MLLLQQYSKHDDWHVVVEFSVDIRTNIAVLNIICSNCHCKKSLLSLLMFKAHMMYKKDMCTSVFWKVYASHAPF